MTTQTLMLGDVDIGSYIRPLSVPLSFEEKTKKENLQQKINALKQDILSFEKFFLDGLENELNDLQKKELECRIKTTGYPEIDLSFLTKSYDKKIGEASIDFRSSKKKDVFIKIPAFSVYPFFGENNKFSIGYSIRITSSSNEDYRNLNISISLPPYSIQDQPNQKILIKNIVKSMIAPFKFSYKDYSGNCVSNEIAKEDLPKELEEITRNWYKPLSLELTSQFNGLIPQKVKEKVKKSQDYFTKEDIYLIAETKPEEWGVKEVKHDPLVIGMNNEKAYIIDHFNCTPLENLVKDIYAGRNN